MKTRKATWVTVIGNAATVTPHVCTVHRTWEAAQKEAARARFQDRAEREVLNAEVVQRMQDGMSYTDALQSLAGSAVIPVYVKAMF